MRWTSRRWLRCPPWAKTPAGTRGGRRVLAASSFKTDFYLRLANGARTRERPMALNRNAFRSAAPCTLICPKIFAVPRRAGLDLREVGGAAARGTNRQQEWINPRLMHHSLPHGWARPVVVATNRSVRYGEADVAPRPTK